MKKPKQISESLSDENIHKIIDCFNTEEALLFKDYKIATLKRRVQRRMDILAAGTFDNFLEIIKNDIHERNQLLEDFLINVTEFFRDKEAYEIFQNDILPQLIQNCTDENGLKIWVCACSTGEEAYSLSIMIAAYLEEHNLKIPYRIFATDINKENIKKARKNQYTKKEISCVPNSILTKYFLQNGNHFSVISQIKNQIYFSAHNVLKNPPVINTDFISCRNLLIYLKMEQQYKVLYKLQYSLKPNGILWLGANESSSHLSDSFSELDARWKFYRKKEETTPTNESVYDFNETYTFPTNKKSDIFTMNKNIDIHHSLLDELGFAIFIINKEFDIISNYGEYNLYLKMPEHQLKLNLFNMLPEGAKYEVRIAILESIEKNERKKIQDIPLDEQHTCNVWILPNYNQNPELINVVFGNYSQVKTIEKSTEDHKKKSEYKVHVEQELSQLKKKYDALTKEFDNNTYSLQIINEDLMSTNEEMQSANEELQALNEELNNLNIEYQQKIRELQQLNDDFDNYFNNAHTAQIILDQDLNIKRFNPEAQLYFNIRIQDIGRPLSHFSNSFVDYDLFKNLTLAISKNDYRTADVSITNDKHATVHIAPYIKQNNVIDGVVITIVDTTDIYQINSVLQALFHNRYNGLIVLKPEFDERTHSNLFRITAVNSMAESIIGKSEIEVINKSIYSVMSDILGEKGINALMRSYSTDEKIIENIAYTKGLVTMYFEIAFKPISNGIILIMRDTTKLMEAINEQKRNYLELLSSREEINIMNMNLEETVNIRTKDLVESNERFNLLSLATNDIIKDWDLVDENFWINDNFYTILGYPKVFQIKNLEDWLNIIDPEDREKYKNYVNHFNLNRSSEFEIEYNLLDIDGEKKYVHEKGFLYYDEGGEARRFISSIRELTIIKEAQRVLNQQLIHRNQFLSVASHELKTPITSIKGSMQLLDLYYSDDQNETAKKLINTALNQTNKLSAFVDDLLDVSRINEGKLSINTDKINLIPIIKNIIEEKLMFTDKNIIFKTQENINDKILGDEKRLEQVFVSIITNADQFSPNADKIIININNDNLKNIIISIQDFGIGMSQAKLKTILELFNNPDKKNNGISNLGISMFISKNIINQHFGSIEIKSEIGEGTTIDIKLPLAE